MYLLKSNNKHTQLMTSKHIFRLSNHSFHKKIYIFLWHSFTWKEIRLQQTHPRLSEKSGIHITANRQSVLLQHSSNPHKRANCLNAQNSILPRTSITNADIWKSRQWPSSKKRGIGTLEKINATDLDHGNLSGVLTWIPMVYGRMQEVVGFLSWDTMNQALNESGKGDR